MTQPSNATSPFVIERTFRASADQVWQAISTRAAIKEWFFDMENFRPELGAEFSFTVEHAGFTYHHRCKVMEVLPGRKFAFTWRYEGYQGDSLVSFELFPEGERTRLKLTHSGLETFPAQPAFARKNFEGGWTNLIGAELLKYLETASGRAAAEANAPSLTISRVFNAPREIVFQAWTEPARLTQWFRPEAGFATPQALVDLRVGGKYRIQMKRPDGEFYTAAGTYLEIAAPAKLVFTWGWEKDGSGPEYGEMEPHESRMTLEFHERGNQTELVLKHEKFASVESRNNHEQGWNLCFDQLANHLQP